MNWTVFDASRIWRHTIEIMRKQGSEPILSSGCKKCNAGSMISFRNGQTKLCEKCFQIEYGGF